MKQRCAWCGREYENGESPCDTCGHETFESVPGDNGGSPFETGSVMWVCTDCGREHVKHSPPCTRCGGHDLEKREVSGEDLTAETTSPGYLDVGKPYLAGTVAVVAFVALVAVGILPFPGVGGPPAAPEAPGDADRSNGMDLRSAEAALHERFESDRRGGGVSERTLGSGGTGAYIEYVTRHRVAERYDPEYGGSVPDPEAFDLRCGTQPVLGVLTPAVDVGAYENDSVFADALAEALLEEDGFRDALLDERDNEAVTIHVGPDGTVFVGYLAC